MTNYDTQRLNDVRGGVLYIAAMALTTDILLAGGPHRIVALRYSIDRMIRPTMALPMGVSFVVVERPSGLTSIKPKPGSPHLLILPRSANNLEATDREKPASVAYSPRVRPSFSEKRRHDRQRQPLAQLTERLECGHEIPQESAFIVRYRLHDDRQFFLWGTIWTKLFCSSRLCFALSTLLLEAFIVHTQRILLALVGLDLGGLEQLVCFQKIRVGHILYLAKKLERECVSSRSSVHQAAAYIRAAT
jgi:hypothetical protein